MPVTAPFGLQATQCEEFIHIGNGVITAALGLGEPEAAQGIKGISIEIGEFLPLLPHALGPTIGLFRRHPWLGFHRDRPQLYLPSGWASVDGGGGPRHTLDCRKRIMGEALTDGLVVGGIQDSEMLVVQERCGQGWCGYWWEIVSQCLVVEIPQAGDDQTVLSLVLLDDQHRKMGACAINRIDEW